MRISDWSSDVCSSDLTWDMIGMQRAIWSLSVPTVITGATGTVRLLPGTYYVNKRVRWTGQAMVNLIGAGQLHTNITSNNWTTHETFTPAVGAAPWTSIKALLDLSRGGPGPMERPGFGLPLVKESCREKG